MLVALAALAAAFAAQGTAAAAQGEWLAGDLHVHTCFSHDAFCLGVDDPAEEPENLYTQSLTVGERFLEAKLRGLDYLAITDHEDVRSVDDPGFGAHGVIGVPGYENSIDGHAQMLGATTKLDNGDESAAAINALAGGLRAVGGVFQANHPGYTPTEAFASCADTGTLDWGYGYDVQPDVIEVWNPTSPIATAEAYLECWLARGARVGVTGGSDSHWASIAAVQGVGQPTTWVRSGSRSAGGVLAGIRAGRTTISRLAPLQNSARLLIEARRHGVWSSAIGEEVPVGTPLRARMLGGALGGFLDVRANGRTVVTRMPMGPRALIALPPAGPGWIRARLHSTPAPLPADPGCGPYDQPASTCAEDFTVLAMTSPVYVR